MPHLPLSARPSMLRGLLSLSLLLASACRPLASSTCTACRLADMLGYASFESLINISIELASTRLACMDGARRCWLCWRPHSADASDGLKLASLSAPVELLACADLPGKGGL